MSALVAYRILAHTEDGQVQAIRVGNGFETELSRRNRLNQIINNLQSNPNITRIILKEFSVDAGRVTRETELPTFTHRFGEMNLD